MKLGNLKLFDPFHWCALAAGSIAKEQDRLGDSDYVRRLAYAMYEAAIKISGECYDKR